MSNIRIQNLVVSILSCAWHEARESLLRTGTPQKPISAAEETYRRQTGKYLQIQPGNALPSYESGTVSEKLGKTIPDNVRVDIYEAPGGAGYQVSYEGSGGTKYSFGYGPEAADRTYTIKSSIIVSTTSTPQ